MRIKGNIFPEIISIESYDPKPGYVELRLRDNIRKLPTEEDTSIYEYDEFTFLLKDREGLREEVESNRTQWVATGRSLEVNEKATLICELREEIARLKEELLK
jgi:hypothetical protein